MMSLQARMMINRSQDCKFARSY